MFYWSVKGVPKVEQAHKQVQVLAEELTKESQQWEVTQKCEHLPKILKKIEDKITLVLAIAFKFLLKSMMTPKKRKTAEIILIFTRMFWGDLDNYRLVKLDFSIEQIYWKYNREQN